MMASGLAATSAQTARSANEVATSVILGEITTFVAGQPLAASLATRLNRGIKQGTLTRDGAIERIIQTPQVEASLVQSLTEEMLNRAPTPAESRALIAGTRGDGADVPKILVQMMSTPEYYNDQGGTNTGFVQAATLALLNRPASPDELATDVTRLDRGGAAARTQFLQTLTGGREFRLAETQDAYQQFAGTSSTAKEQASALKAFQGPLGYTKMLAQVLRSDATSTGLIPTYAENSGLSVKRVPGFLAGWKPPNLAAPFDVANVPNRQIDDKTVDYWAITLNALDAVSLTIVPNSNPTNAGFAVRIWGPDGTEIGAAVTGDQFTFVAKTAGTYTLGISTSDNTGYAFSPDAKQPAPSGPPVTFTAEFQTYPGANTNTVSILLNYKNPAYTANNNWPTLTNAQNQAYQKLKMIASASSQVLGPLKNFTDFEQVGDEADYQTIAGWLTATWAPFQNLLNNASHPGDIADTYNAFPVIRQAYPTEAAFSTQVATPFLEDPATQAAFVSVDELLEGADSARQDIAEDYLDRFNAWATANYLFVKTDPTDIAALMVSGTKDVPDLPKPVDLKDIFKRIGYNILNTLAGLAGLIIGPEAGVAAYDVVGAIENGIDAYQSGDFGDNPTPPKSNPNIIADAQDLAHDADVAYFNTFADLTSQPFLSSIFSNYGLLEAMGSSQFTYSLTNVNTPATVLKASYDESIWEQLLPQVYTWRLVKPTDNGPADTLPNFTFFIPYSEKAQWQTPALAKPYDGSAVYWDYYPQTGKFAFTLPGGKAQAIADAESEVASLESGATNIPFPGYDFTPSNDNDQDWFGPGPVSGPQVIAGSGDRFYTISPNSHLKETLYRETYSAEDFSDRYNWYTSAELEGVTIHQWALEMPKGTNGKDGWVEMSQAAADALFGTGAPSTIGAGLVADKDGGSYFDFAIPEDGAATRFDAFTQWGVPIEDDPTMSLQPPNISTSDSMKVGLNPKNYYSRDIETSYVTDYSLDFDSPGVKSVRKSLQVSPDIRSKPRPAKRI